MSLEGKIVIVTGGSRGIGKEIVLSLAAKGAYIAFTYQNQDNAAEEVVRQCNELPGEVKPHKVDMRNQNQVKSFVKEVIAGKGTIDVLVSNAGIRKDKSILSLQPDEWNDVITTNLNGTFYLAQAALFYMLKKKEGRVIVLSSISGLSGIAGQTNYSSSKAGLIGFTRALAKEVAPYGISVNAIAPGGVETDMTATMPEKERAKLIQNVPMGRLCTTKEIAQVVLFLADQELSPAYLTGSTIVLDGGFGI